MISKSEKTIKPDKKVQAKKTRKDEYIYAVGRRKTATVRVRLYPNKEGNIIVNEKPIDQYFFGECYKKIYLEPLRICNVIGKYLITIKVKGSGKMGQLGAVIHGVSRVLAKLNEEKFKPLLRKRGFLTRDPRKRERRKVGMGGKARRKRQSPRR